MVQVRCPISCRSALLGTLLLGSLSAGCQSHGQKPAEIAEQTDGPGSAAELTQRGQHALARGDATRAEQYFTLALEKGGDASTLVPLVVKTCIAQSRLRAALNHAEPHLIDHPQDLALRYLVATLYLSLGHDTDAHKQLSVLTHYAPEYPDAHFLLGVMHQRAEQDPEARSSFETYLALAPSGSHAAEARSHVFNLEIAASSPSEKLSTAPTPLREPSAPIEADGHDRVWTEVSP